MKVTVRTLDSQNHEIDIENEEVHCFLSFDLRLLN